MSEKERRAVMPQQGEQRGSNGRQALLDSSAGDVEAKVTFANVAARRAGLDVDEIAGVTGLSVSMIRAAIGTS